MVTIDQKVIDAACEIGHVAEKMKLEPDELLAALYMAINAAITAKHKIEIFQNIQLL